jgi:hypothetical protein
MAPSQRNSCLLYSLLRFVVDEKIYVDYETLEPLPILTAHLMALSTACPDIMYRHEIYFAGKDGAARKATFLSNPRVVTALQTYTDKFLRDTPSIMPPPPEWVDLSPEPNSELNAIFNQRSRSRKSRKQRKQTRKQLKRK